MKIKIKWSLQVLDAIEKIMSCFSGKTKESKKIKKNK